MTDPLAAYMRAVRRLPPVSEAEQAAAAVEYARTKSSKAKERLAASCLKLVVREASRFARGGAREKVADLVQEGNLGLLRAAERFDPGRGCAFLPYAMYWVRAFQLAFLCKYHRIVSASSNGQRKLFFRMSRTAARIEAASGGDVSELDEKIAAELGVAVSAVKGARGRLAPEETLDALSVRAASLEPSPEEKLLAEQRRQLARRELEEFAKTLDEPGRAVLWRRLAAAEPETLEEVGRGLGVSRERTRQVEARVVAGLRARLASGPVRVALGFEE